MYHRTIGNHNIATRNFGKNFPFFCFTKYYGALFIKRITVKVKNPKLLRDTGHKADKAK